MPFVNENDLQQIKALGFSISGTEPDFLSFLREHLPGLRLADLLKDIDNRLSPLTAAALFKELHFFEKEPPMLMLQYYSEDEADEKTGLGFSCTFTRYASELVVDHDFFRLPEKHRGQGKGKELIAVCLEHYLECGVSRAIVDAGLEDGGLVWAKLFFVATKKLQVGLILANARVSLSAVQYQAVKKVYEVYYSRLPDGKDFPMALWSTLPGMEQVLRESRWDGELDLTDSKVLAKFNLLK